MTANEIRSRYLAFFEARGHRRYPSDSLVPKNDPSLLFTGAGMNQFKEMFLGVGTLPFKRATTAQKCIRTGDIERVGTTPRHLTFFEMLGNFSFGDYFKKDAIAWAWEFVTKELGLPGERLLVSVYKDDPEAEEIWRSSVGIPKSRIYRFGEADNFWPASAPSQGPNGPCGPCSEIYYDNGPEHGCGKPECDPSCSCARYCEIWNLVFTQFDRQDGGKLVPLPQKNIDTGAGFERFVAVKSGVVSVFDTELFQPMIAEVARRSGKSYAAGGPDAVRMRRIADHARAATFCLSDGAVPGNEGRNYVVRRVIRRAINDGKQLGIDGAFLHTIVPVVARIMGDAYPDVRERSTRIETALREEEERFGETYEQGRSRLEARIAELKTAGKKVLPGEDAFRLHDTYGFPLDLAEIILAEHGLTADRAAFETAMERQREMARGGSQFEKDIFGRGPLVIVKERHRQTEFLGYDRLESDGRVLALIQDKSLVDEAREGSEVEVVTDRTPFYGEAGGQVGDAGAIHSDRAKALVDDTQRADGLFLHHVKVASGRLHVGEEVQLSVAAGRRHATERNHTATHLLHRALHDVLGEHAEQAGSLVSPDRLRFDFTHTKGMSSEEVRDVERRINERILADLPVTTKETSFDAAKKEGAMALFGEKYGDRVRVVDVQGYSKELCGGTHVARTGEIGALFVVQESSVAAGIRRVEAVTGTGVLDRLHESESLVTTIGDLLRAPRNLVERRIEEVLEDNRKLKRSLEQAERARAQSAADDFAPEWVETTNGRVRLFVRQVPGLSGDALRTLSDQLRTRRDTPAAPPPPSGILLLAPNEGKVGVLAALSKDLVARGLSAKDLQDVALRVLGGRGGGRPDLAQGQGADASKADAAVQAALEWLRSSLAK
ncbi:MAG: alanine--tRNA ligase [Planctomycetes bacterium]|nr:alanine--tRNA ligase [Planctomycetota bacterium]MBI3844641.1 alanine--tRNA ligase [Planctomycetota bacterium]